MNTFNPLFRFAMTLMFVTFGIAFNATADHHGGQKHQMNHDKKAGKGAIQEALVILSSESLQTQGMAMVLSNTLANSGVSVQVLLCDSAGDLALRNSESALMKPKNVSPKMLMKKLQKQGANISVCALYLPNSTYTKTDLLEGVQVATPKEISSLMASKKTRVFTF